MRGRVQISFLDAPAWRDASAAATQLPPGATPSFLDAVAGSLEGATGGALLVESRAGRVGLPFVNWAGMAISMPFGIPGGPVPLEGDPIPVEPRAIRKALDLEKLIAYIHYTRATDYPKPSARDMHSTHVVRLGGDDPRRVYRKRARQNLKAAEKAGLEVRVGTPRDADLLVTILSKASAEAGRSLYPPAHVVRAVALSDQALSVFALHEGREVSGALFLQSSVESLYWLSGSLVKSSRFSPSYAVVDMAMEQAREQGRLFFNLGSSDGLPNVAHFKEGFGAERVTYPSLESSSLRLRLRALRS